MSMPWKNSSRAINQFSTSLCPRRCSFFVGSVLLAGKSLILQNNFSLILKRFSIENFNLTCSSDNYQVPLQLSSSITFESAKFVGNLVLVFGKQNNLSYFQIYDQFLNQVGKNVDLGDLMENFTATLAPGQAPLRISLNEFTL